MKKFVKLGEEFVKKKNQQDVKIGRQYNMVLDSHQAKLFIKVDGVIGERRQICLFCNNTIHGVEKVVETTRKLRRGPYFPQLAHLQSSVGKIDTMGRAVVCLACFHQLLRQWNSFEMNNIPMSERIYKHVSGKDLAFVQINPGYP